MGGRLAIMRIILGLTRYYEGSVFYYVFLILKLLFCAGLLFNPSTCYVYSVFTNNGFCFLNKAFLMYRCRNEIV